MLCVVEHQQAPLVAQGGGKPLVERLSRLLLHADRLCQCRQQEGRVVERRERHPGGAVEEPVGHLGCGLERQPRLARAAWPGERQEPYVVAGEELNHLGQLVLPAQERCRRHREVRTVERLERREVTLSQLEDPLGRRQVLETMLAEITEIAGLDEYGGRRRHEHLAAVPRGGDASGAVDIVADKPFLSEQGRARVDSDSHPDLSVRGEVIRELGSGVEGAGAVGNAKKKASPCVSTSTPPFRIHASRITAR